MSARHFNLLKIFSVSALLLGGASVTRADDSEIFFNSDSSSGGNANILLILDTSGSMNRTAMSAASSEPAPYNKDGSYSDSGVGCADTEVYYTTTSTPPTSCTGLSHFPSSKLYCKAARTALASNSGYYGGADHFIRWGGTGSSYGWSSNMSVSNGTDVECKADNGVYGNSNSSTDNKYPKSGTLNQTSGNWTTTSSQQWWSGTNIGTQIYLWSPKYIRYTHAPPSVIVDYSRLDVVKSAVSSLLDSVSNVNIGLMRYDSQGSGGMVMQPIQALTDTYRDTLKTAINGFLPAGSTPLSEAYYEAYRYLKGSAVDFGDNSNICTQINQSTPGSDASCNSGYTEAHPSIATSRTGDSASSTVYKSPFDTNACGQNTYIIYLTDGLPTNDTSANTDIETLIGHGCTASSSSSSSSSSSGGMGGGMGGGGGGSTYTDDNGKCLAPLASYMYANNLAGGTNTFVTSYFIGFGADFTSTGSTGFTYLNEAAIAGGSQKAYSASNLTSLNAVFNQIVRSVSDTNTTFTSPSVAVNAFNRTQTLNDLFVSVFSPTINRHWEGNLKKYKIINGAITDVSGHNAVESGFFSSTSQSFWSDTVDGSDVTKGGAANRLPDPSLRKIYTYIGSPPSGGAYLSTTDRFQISNAAMTGTAGTTLFNLGGTGEPTPDQLIDWLNGMDVKNDDGNAATTVRKVMGDPIHSPPAVVIYGGTETSPDIVTFVTTNDGFLHAVNGASTTDVTVGGNELWSFIPQEFLTELKQLYANGPSEIKQYMLDGEIEVLKYDVNGDGIIDKTANDRVILFFSMGRGGDYYYAMDVTEKDKPKFLWKLSSTQLPGVQQSWSKPKIARVNISGATQNQQKLVIIFGGGYDSSEDGQTYVTADSYGNRIYMVDATRGTVLWSAGPSTSTANLKLARMDHAIPGAITVVDTDSDGFADRMYAADTAAQIWRFDIHNGKSATGTGTDALVTGGVIASLGTRDITPVVAANARRFSSSPDVALVTDGNQSFYNISIGSGHRGHPLNTDTQDWFYSIRDTKPFQQMTQTQYDNFVIVTQSDTDLQNITDNVNAVSSASARGWKLKLEHVGEKSLSTANTVNNTVLFTTYIPNTGNDQDNSNSCNTFHTGTNLVYAISVFNGAPVKNLSETSTSSGGVTSEGLTKDDRTYTLEQGGIAPQVTVILGEQETTCADGDTTCHACDPSSQSCDIVPTYVTGDEVIPGLGTFNVRNKTYWRELSAP